MSRAGKTYYQQNAEKVCERTSQWQRDHRESGRRSNAKWRANNVEYNRARIKKWREENPEKARALVARFNKNNPNYKKEWWAKNYYTGRYNKKDREYARRRYHADPAFRLMRNTRSRLNRFVKTGKPASTLGMVGCKSWVAYKEHIESLFLEGMSWDNKESWHIDHIVPIASFDLTNPGEYFKAFHYTNTQPLWAKDNRRKGAKLPHEWVNSAKSSPS